MGDYELLRAYEPIVRFTNGELFLPTDVNGYVARCSLWETDAAGKPRLVVPTGELTLERLCAHGRERADMLLYLRFAQNPLWGAAQRRWRRTHRAKAGGVGRLGSVGILARFVDLFLKVSLLLRGTLPGALVAAAETSYREELAKGECTYYGRVLRSGGYLVLQYWYFYVMNDWRSTFGGINDHEADWEMACIYLAERPGSPPQPVWVALSSHDYTGDDLRRRWDDPELLRQGHHPVFFAGGGSHSGAFVPGDYVIQVALAGVVGGIVRASQATARVAMPWRREKVTPGLRIPFIDYARGDGTSVGDGEGIGWSPELINDATPWVADYRGLWGLDTLDRFGGERAPAGPRYDRDGSPRFAWTDPVAWAGLEKVPAQQAEAAASLRYRLESLDHELTALRAEIATARQELRASWQVVRSLARRHGTRALQDSWRLKTSERERRLNALLQTQADLSEERAAHINTLSDPLETDPPQAHLRTRRLPYVARRPPRTRLLRLWSALTVPLLMGAVVVLLVNPTGGVLSFIGAVLLLFLMVEAFAHRRLLAFLLGVGAAFLAFVLFSTLLVGVIGILVVAITKDWRVTLAAILSAFACLLLLVNLRDLFRH